MGILIFLDESLISYVMLVNTFNFVFVYIMDERSLDPREHFFPTRLAARPLDAADRSGVERDIQRVVDGFEDRLDLSA